jgi:hypothetical protein
LYVSRHHDTDSVLLRDGAPNFLDGFRDHLRRNDGRVLDPMAGTLTEILRPIVVSLRQLDGEIEFPH